MSFCSAGDGASRDPVSLRIEGSQNGTEWVLLHETGDKFPTPTCRRCWSPWLLLHTQGSAPEVWTPDTEFHDAVRHRCLVLGCTDPYATKEGYLIQGKLLRHMMRLHPEAEATHQLKQQMRCREAARAKARGCSKRGRVTRHRFLRSKRSSAPPPPLLPRAPRQGVAAAAAAAAAAAGAAAVRACGGPEEELGSASAPVTPERPAAPQTTAAGCAGLTDSAATPLMTPARPQAPATACSGVASGGRVDNQSPVKRSVDGTSVAGCAAAALGSPSACTLLRLSSLMDAPLGGLVDVEAVVYRVGKLRQMSVKRRPGVLMQVRRFMLRDGPVSCLWVLWGKHAESFDERLRGCRVVLRGAKVHVVKSARHLSGCMHVDVCRTMSLD